MENIRQMIIVINRVSADKPRIDFIGIFIYPRTQSPCLLCSFGDNSKGFGFILTNYSWF